MKRSRGSDGRYLTGGTGDVKPQILTLNTGQNAPGKYVLSQIALPVPRFGGQKNKATIMEILRIYWYPGLKDILEPVDILVAYLTTAPIRTTGDTVNATTIQDDAGDPFTIGMVVMQSYEHLDGVDNAALANRHWPIVLDLTDGAGNGVLIGTDKISIVGGNSTGTLATSFIAKVMYRLVNVDIAEYIGIIQAQN